MSGSIYGRLFQVSTWGESHGAAIGVVNMEHTEL